MGVVLVALVLMYWGASQPKPEPPPPPRRCQTIPTEVAAWGLSVQSTSSGLYFCYQQGAGRGMTEIVCTPMKDCK